MDDHAALLMRSKRLTPAEAAVALPDEPGIYAIFVDDPASMPQPYADLLRERRTGLIYIGKAEESLRRRAYEEELRHRRAATFFRSLGAALGYLPPSGSLRDKANKKNYRFSTSDTQQILAWIDAHLKTAAIPLPTAAIEEAERRVIVASRPLFNLQNNPLALEVLKRARARCIAVAAGEA
jgi:hypothetical protein